MGWKIHKPMSFKIRSIQQNSYYTGQFIFRAVADSANNMKN